MMYPLKGYEGKYWINESGVVINKKGHAIRTAVSNSGYMRVSLDDGHGPKHRKNESIHRLVAETFIPNPDNLPVVMHIDDDKLNNHVTNLKWGTQSENCIQSVANKRKYNQYSYEIFNDSGDSVICNSRKELSDELGYNFISLKNMVGNGHRIACGPYKGYQIRNLGPNTKNKNIIQPVYFYK